MKKKKCCFKSALPTFIKFISQSSEVICKKLSPLSFSRISVTSFVSFSSPSFIFTSPYDFITIRKSKQEDRWEAKHFDQTFLKFVETKNPLDPAGRAPSFFRMSVSFTMSAISSPLIIVLLVKLFFLRKGLFKHIQHRNPF